MRISSEKGIARRMKWLRVNLKKSADETYEIHIEESAIDRIAGILHNLVPADRWIVITDSNVSALYGALLRERLGSTSVPLDVIEFPAGEPSKSVHTLAEVSRQLVRLGASRKTLLIAFGGGVVGDLTGFAASIYMRGIPFIQIPTTLLAQVDSSVGGKTGVDLPEGKNLLGTFYQPKAVFADLNFLATLSDADFKTGLSEIIKYAVISDEEMFEILAREYDAISGRTTSYMKDLVFRSCSIKASIVEQDEHEGDLRRILNFGHTLGHALEAASDFSLCHGDAIAIGMAAAAKISVRLGCLDQNLCDRIIWLIDRYGLPTSIPARFDADDVIRYMASDKKKVAGKLHFVLVTAIGKPFITSEVSTAMVKQVIEELKA